jgi:Pyridoxamine 5'-phosphate oxidase
MASTLPDIAPAFVQMAHRIVWATAATVDERGRPWTRVLHPIWQWDGERLTGWIATGPTPAKRAHLAAHPYVSLTYWDPAQDTASVHCRATLHTDDETRTEVWERFRTGPEPVGYDPAIIPAWDGPLSPGFAALRLEPWMLRVQPAAVLLEGAGDQIMVWREET